MNRAVQLQSVVHGTYSLFVRTLALLHGVLLLHIRFIGSLVFILSLLRSSLRTA